MILYAKQLLDYRKKYTKKEEKIPEYTITQNNNNPIRKP